MPDVRGNAKRAGIAGAISAAVILIAPVVAQWEGKSNDPYKDIVGVSTVCFGQTKVAMRHYTDAECRAMLQDSLEGYGAAVLERNPELRDRPYQLAAAISLSYNIGNSAYWNSTVAKRFSAHNWRGGCDAFLAWRFAGGKPVQGLLNRRNAERQICLTDLGAN